jgi:transposase
VINPADPFRPEGVSGRKSVVTRRQLSDEQWKLIEPYLPIGEYGPYPKRLRDQFEGVIWRFRTSAQWREMPGEFGPWPTVYGRFRVWRDAGVFTALMEGLIAEAARRGRADLSLVSVDSTTARAHHDAAGMLVGADVMDALEEAAAEQEKARQKGDARRNRTGGTAKTGPSGKSADASADDEGSALGKPGSEGHAVG